MIYQYRVTETPLRVQRKEGEPDYDPKNPFYNWREATDEERQLPQPGPEWRLSNSFSDRDNTVVTCIWERVVEVDKTP